MLYLSNMKVRLIKSTTAVLLFTFFLNLQANSQAPTDKNQLSGEWTGISKYLGQRYAVTTQLQQNGVKLTGELFIETLDKTKHATYTLNGIIDDDKVTLKGLEFIEKKGAWCLPTIHLTYSLQDGNQVLAGKWKSNNVKGGCLLGVSGSFEIMKEVSKPAVSPVATTNKSGDYMVQGLKNRKYYALLIAVEAYDDPDVSDLDNTISDARILWNSLSMNYTFDQQNMTFLKNPTRSEVLETFDKLSQTLTETDQLLIYYGGHGVWDEKLEQGYWLTADAKRNSKADWISNSTIKDYIRSFDSKHTLLIADACFSGGIFKERDAFAYGKAMLEMYKMPSRKAITSGTLTTVPDKSVFMQYLVNGLDKNADPLYSAEQLFYDLKIAVINNSPNGQVPQYGVIRQTDDQGGAFIFLKR